MSEIQGGTPGTSVSVEGPTGAVGRLIGVFTQPGKTFASIANRPGWNWVVPVILAAAAAFVYMTVAYPKIDVDDATAQQMKLVDKMTQGRLSEEQRAEQEQKVRDGVLRERSLPARLGFSCIVLLPLFFVPMVYHLLAKAFGRSKRYMGVVACYAYLFVIPIITYLLSTLIAWSKDSLDVNDAKMMRVLKSNPAAFYDFQSANKVLLAFLSTFDIFDVILFVLTTIAISKATTFTTKGAAILVGCWWGFYLLLKIVGAVLLSSFMG